MLLATTTTTTTTTVITNTSTTDIIVINKHLSMYMCVRMNNVLHVLTNYYCYLLIIYLRVLSMLIFVSFWFMLYNTYECYKY